MKLLFCTECEDIIKLRLYSKRKCSCGKVSGKYIDEINAEFSGPAIPLGIDNNYFIYALNNYPNIPDENSLTIKAFLIPKECDSLKKVKEIANNE